MVSIIIEASDVWSYFHKNKAKLETAMEAIAENPDYGVVIYLSSSEDGLPLFTVTADEYQYDEEAAVSDSDCKHTAQKLYDQYLTEKFLESELDGCDDGSLFNIEDQIAEREWELDDVVALLISTATEEDNLSFGNDFDEILEDVKDHVLEYLARKHELIIRRPMMLEDENGEEFFEEYPYECMVFDDEDNPIYQK